METKRQWKVKIRAGQSFREVTVETSTHSASTLEIQKEIIQILRIRRSHLLDWDWIEPEDHIANPIRAGK